MVLDQGSGRYVRLNPSGARLWDALGRPCTPPRLAQMLVTEFGIAPRRATADAERFVAELKRLDLIAVRGA